MAKEIHAVTFYEMEEKEVLTAKLLPEMTLKMIKNLHANEWMARSNLEPTPNDYASYVQKHAEHSGAILAYQALIDGHQEAVEYLSRDQHSQ